MANHMISLVKISTTDPRTTNVPQFCIIFCLVTKAKDYQASVFCYDIPVMVIFKVVYDDLGIYSKLTTHRQLAIG